MRLITLTVIAVAAMRVTSAPAKFPTPSDVVEVVKNLSAGDTEKLVNEEGKINLKAIRVVDPQVTRGASPRLQRQESFTNDYDWGAGTPKASPRLDRQDSNTNPFARCPSMAAGSPRFDRRDSFKNMQNSFAMDDAAERKAAEAEALEAGELHRSSSKIPKLTSTLIFYVTALNYARKGKGVMPRRKEGSWDRTFSALKNA